VKVRESQGKAMCFRKKKGKRKKKKLTDESATAFNFSKNRHKHTFYAFIMLENVLNDCFDAWLMENSERPWKITEF